MTSTRIPDRTVHLGAPDAYPTHVAGAEQYDHRLKSLDELAVAGYCTDRPASAPVTPVYGPIAPDLLRSDLPTSLVPQRIAERGGIQAPWQDVERAADAFLAFHTGDAMRLDVMVEVTRPDGVSSGWDTIVKADRVAWRGKARYRTRWARYSKPGAFVVNTQGVCTDRRHITYVLQPVNGRHLKFVGHRAVTTLPRDEQRKIERQTARVGAMGKRGKAVEPMAANVRTVRRHWTNATADQRATAEQIESILRTAADGATVPLTSTISVVAYPATVVADGRSYTVREYARRAALAGIIPD